MEKYISEFIDEHFDQQYASLTEEQQRQFRVALKQVLFSHRHKKGDLFLENIDFSASRAVMYSYSYKARDEFFSCMYRCFFFNYCLETYKVPFLKKAKKKDTKNLNEEYMKEFDSIEDILNTKRVNLWLN